MRPFPSRVNFMRLHVNDNELDVLRGGVRTVKNTDALHVNNFHRDIRPPIIEKVKEINPTFRIDSKEEYDSEPSSTSDDTDGEEVGFKYV